MIFTLLWPIRRLFLGFLIDVDSKARAPSVILFCETFSLNCKRECIISLGSHDESEDPSESGLPKNLSFFLTLFFDVLDVNRSPKRNQFSRASVESDPKERVISVRDGQFSCALIEGLIID